MAVTYSFAVEADDAAEALTKLRSKLITEEPPIAIHVEKLDEDY